MPAALSRSSRAAEGLLLLEDGTVYEGVAASPGTRFGEVVFNTAMTGYQEILTDPSYRGQIVVMTQPHIGNYGTSEAAAESRRAWAEGLIARRITSQPSGPGSPAALPGYLRRQEVPALEGIDTRSLVRRLRLAGAMRGVLTSERSNLDALRSELADFPTMAGRALVDEVSCSEPFEVAAEGAERCHLALLDFGAKANIVRSLTRRGARVTVLPARTSASDCRALGADGVVLSNGPGDPEPLTGIIEAVRELVSERRPMLGICLGHQLLGLALGGKTFKLKFGHHGANQPVREVAGGRVSITSQNHGFALDAGSLPAGVQVSEINLNDGTVEAFSAGDRPLFAVQYHPEAAPGPHDASGLFDRFLAAIGR